MSHKSENGPMKCEISAESKQTAGARHVSLTKRKTKAIRGRRTIALVHRVQQQVPETIHACKVFESTVWQLVEAGYGFQGGQGPNLLFYDAPFTLPARPGRLFSRLSPYPLWLAAPYIFTISFRCQTFQLTNTLRGTMSRQIRAFARSRSFLARTDGNRSRKLFFRFGRFLPLPTVQPVFK